MTTAPDSAPAENTRRTTKMSPPWIEHFEKIRTLFAADPDVSCRYDDGAKTATLRVRGQRKADAIAALVPARVAFGNVELKISVVPANVAQDAADLLRTAFAGNSALVGVETFDGPFDEPVVFAAFDRAPVDVPCDNMADPAGMKTMLLEHVARDVIGANVGAFLCTVPA